MPSENSIRLRSVIFSTGASSLSRDDKNFQAFLKSLEETQIIDQVDPDLSTLKKYKHSYIKDQVIRIYVKKSIKQLDEEIRSSLLVTK